MQIHLGNGRGKWYNAPGKGKMYGGMGKISTQSANLAQTRDQAGVNFLVRLCRVGVNRIHGVNQGKISQIRNITYVQYITQYIVQWAMIIPLSTSYELYILIRKRTFYLVLVHTMYVLQIHKGEKKTIFLKLKFTKKQRK